MEIPTWLTTILVTVASSSATFLWGRRKANAQAVSTELTNVQTAIKIWREAAEDLTQKVTELQKKVDSLERHVDELTNENKILSAKLRRYTDTK